MSFLSALTRGTLKLLLISGAAACLPGCQRGEVSETAGGPTAEELVSFYSPQSIEIKPFTKPRSFDDDAIPDGVAAYLQPLDAAGEAVKAYGTFVFELFAYRSAAADHRGELLHAWTQPVLNIDDQKQFWDRVINMYEFQLSWEGQPLTPQQKYILTASFQAPGSQRLFDEYEFEFRVQRKEILESLPGSDEP